MSTDIDYLSFDDGDVVPIQADAEVPETPDSPFDDDPHPVRRRKPAEDKLESKERVERSIERIRRFGTMAMERLADMPRKPDKVAVEIAVKVSAGTGVVIASCATEANFKITVEWANPGAVAPTGDPFESPTEPDGSAAVEAR